MQTLLEYGGRALLEVSHGMHPLSSGVERVILNADDAVIVVEATTADGKIIAFQVRKGVIFGRGCFTHDK